MGETTAATTTTTCGGNGNGNGNLLLLPHLSEDILIKILVYLPVKSMLRFKSVCKSWRSLIRSSFFIDLHINTNTTSNFDTFILQTTEPCGDGDDYGDEDDYDSYESDIKLYMLSSGDGDGDDYGGDEDDDDQKKKKKKMVIKLDDLGFLPFKDHQLEDTLRMVGSCNGIICLYDPRVMHEYLRGGTIQQHYSHLRGVSLWNPATRQFRILPKSIPIEEKQDYTWIRLEDFIGFGFDVKTKDYKVLRIALWEGGCKCRVQVYSLSTDSWRLLDCINSLPGIPDQDQFSNHGIYLNGCYFFLGSNGPTPPNGRCDFMLLSFDFAKEIFTTMQLPDDNSSCVLSYLGDKMAVFTGPRIDDGGYEHYDIWVLNEQHSNSIAVSKESWTKLHSFQIERTEYPCNIPICISNNGECAIISTGSVHLKKQLQLINLVTKEAKKDFLIDIQDQQVCGAVVYKESLVSIMGGGNVLLS